MRLREAIRKTKRWLGADGCFALMRSQVVYGPSDEPCEEPIGQGRTVWHVQIAFGWSADGDPDDYGDAGVVPGHWRCRTRREAWLEAGRWVDREKRAGNPPPSSPCPHHKEWKRYQAAKREGKTLPTP